MALNIVCFPADRIADLNEIIRGGVEKVREAGAILVGGHSLKDREPKYGLAALGIVHPERIIRNHTPREGDRLILSKPLGTGIISTALKAEIIREGEAREAVRWMTKLNHIPESILQLSIHSMTDITGFGFLGHLSEMLSGGDFTAEIQVKNVPVLTGAYKLAQQDIIPGGSIANQKNFSCGVQKEKEIHPATEILLYDAQTSGGLLISVGQEDAREALSLLEKEGFENSRIVGRVGKSRSGEKKIHLI